MGARLAGKTALITGASRGIGRGIAEAFAAEGCQLVLNARDSGRLDETARELEAQFGVKVTSMACDVTDTKGVTQMVSNAWEHHPIDILVNNAGVYKPLPFMEYTAADFRDIFDVNVFAAVHITQEMLRKMVPTGRGNVVNIASTAGKWGSRNQSAYNMSKHAVVGMTRCVALEMAPHGIRSNAICPWIVDTDLANGFVKGHADILKLDEATVATNLKGAIPLHKRWIDPAEVAGLAVYLASDEASYVTGQSWTIDGGYTMV
jgi:NAD(P)-dependent dehydrogenase (short-subunit alcohol dehydrogenase family)